MKASTYRTYLAQATRLAGAAFCIAALAGLAVAPSVARAQDSTVSAAGDAATSKAALPSIPAKREDIDEEITNARLRAATGAKSLISMQSAFTYQGGSVNAPLSNTRPTLSQATVENDVKLSGNLSAKYRVTDHDNLNVGVGVGWLTPTYEGQTFQVEDPYVAYGRTFKAFTLQNVLNTQILKYTADSATKGHQAYESDVDHTILWTVPSTHWQLGLNGAWTHEFYSQTVNGGYQDTVALFPFAEYEFNSRLSFRTVYRGLTYFNTMDTTGTFSHQDSTQSLGLGVTLTRDIYLYPNVQWAWENIRSEVTNVALNAYINL